MSMSIAAPVSAAHAIGEFLQSPDDLQRIQALRKKLEKEKASIDSRLKSGVKEQLDATREGLVKLLGTRNHVQTIKDEMETVDRECSDPKSVVSTFDQISAVSIVHRNFEQTEEIVDNLLAMNDQLEAIEQLLETDRKKLLGRAPNLLAIHYQINQLESFRNQTLHQAKKATSDSRLRLTKWFERLNGVIEKFDEYIVALAKNILALAQKDRTEVIVKLLKIAEVEGKADEKAIVIKLVKKAAKLDASSKFKSMQAEARVIKHYRGKITSSVTESISETFAEAYDVAGDPAVFIDRLDTWMFDDLECVETVVAPCFPPDWHIHNHFVKEYHKALDARFNSIITSSPEASVMLSLHSWIKEYRPKMRQMGVNLDLLEPPLLDGKVDKLIDDYLIILTKKFQEWTSELQRTELKAFMERAAAPEEDADGLFGSEETSIFFGMVNQQIDSAAQSGKEVIITKTIDEITQVMRASQQQWVSAMDAQFKIQLERPSENAPGLELYTISVANDQIKMIDFVEGVLERLDEMLTEESKTHAQAKFNEAINGFLDVTEKCTKLIIDFMLNDLGPAIKELFGPKWYDGDPMAQIVVTLQDYMSDCQDHLHESLLEGLVEDLIEAFLVIYITGLVNTPKLKMPIACDKIKADAEALFRFFATVKKPKDLEVDFDLLDKVLEMLESSRSVVFVSYWRFAKEFGPNVNFVETLLKTRDDLDRAAINEIMESVRRKVKDENLVDPEKDTIMKKVTIQGSAFSRFLRS